MKFFTCLVLSVFIANSALAAGSSYTWSKAEYGYNRNVLGDPWVYNRVLENCMKESPPKATLEKLSAFMHVPVSQVTSLYCRRTLKAYESGRISYDDYHKLQAEHVMSPTIAKVIQGK
ncbi:hypothetical protein DTW90_10110 [Neorhizobium sp. P12A]|jgi:hypothetical protein|uniref:hypothetical protein n=1 Tax=Rhizobium/Agrobacterium group TaxID=227290 RepID=UPI001050BD85|nr:MULTISPECIES: hypothetical protein [Rhizobium/Agrobacterium group]KAA0699703.1 hypothetical protein DTW90_10110 [Neorhizobium sp. P12A]TCR91336.1 hypothetical protein EV561_103734 [Rhizobium sp. BK376]